MLWTWKWNTQVGDWNKDRINRLGIMLHRCNNMRSKWQVGAVGRQFGGEALLSDDPHKEEIGSRRNSYGVIHSNDGFKIQEFSGKYQKQLQIVISILKLIIV